MTKIWNLLREIWDARRPVDWLPGSGRWCRVCGLGIRTADEFGLSEGVCPACRGDLAA